MELLEKLLVKLRTESLVESLNVSYMGLPGKFYKRFLSQIEPLKKSQLEKVELLE